MSPCWCCAVRHRRLLLIGVVLFFVTVLINKQLGISPSRHRDMEHLENATFDDD